MGERWCCINNKRAKKVVSHKGGFKFQINGSHSHCDRVIRSSPFWRHERIPPFFTCVLQKNLIRDHDVVALSVPFTDTRTLKTTWPDPSDVRGKTSTRMLFPIIRSSSHNSPRQVKEWRATRTDIYTRHSSFPPVYIYIYILTQTNNHGTRRRMLHATQWRAHDETFQFAWIQLG